MQRHGVLSARPLATDPTAHVAAELAFLRNPASYPEQPSRVEVIETHFAWVFLAGTHSYKLKKPTHLRGADWRTPQARELACREELRLNRQISPLTYLGVEPLIETPAGLQIGGTGTAIDWLLVMRRLDRRRMLDAILRSGTLTREDLDSVLTFLMSFYHSRTPIPFAAETYLRRLTSRLEEAITALEQPAARLPQAGVRRLASALRGALYLVRSPLAERARSGRIVEAHGDLRAEHICLGPPVQVIDALEVYADLRMLDTAEEVAMLAFECERYGARWAAAYVRNRYRSLAADSCSDALFDFYTALRAATQAKLAIWHLDDLERAPDPAPWRARALAAAAGALRHCRAIVREPRSASVPASR